MNGTMGERFGAEPNALFDALLPLITDDMLQEIAEVDFELDVEKHFVPLKLFRHQRIIPTLNWYPNEVLTLVRWLEPDQPTRRPGFTGKRGHLLRAFSCALLLRAYERPENQGRWFSFNETAIQLALSLKVLGEPMDLAGGRFFAWCLDALTPLDEEGIEGPFLALALLSFVYSSDDYADDDVIALCKWIDVKVSALLQEKQWFATRSWNWLLSTNHNDMKNERWIAFGRKLYHWAEAQVPSDRAGWVAYIGRALAEEPW